MKPIVATINGFLAISALAFPAHTDGTQEDFPFPNQDQINDVDDESIVHG